MRALLGFYSVGELQFNLVGEAALGEQAINLTIEQKPALILLGMEFSQKPDQGIETLMKLREVLYKGKVLVLSDSREDEFIFRAMQSGAFGYVLKDRMSSQLHNALTTVVGGQIYLCPEAATGFFRRFHFNTGQSVCTPSTIKLTNREQEVLKLLVEGACNEKIAQSLFITVATVKAHLTSIFEALGVNSRSQAIVKTLKLGIV